MRLTALVDEHLGRRRSREGSTSERRVATVKDVKIAVVEEDGIQVDETSQDVGL